MKLVAPPFQSLQPASIIRQATVEVGQPRAKYKGEFEAMFLGVLMEQALPRGGAVFGNGVAGSVARGQLAQELARVLAASGVLGLGARTIR